MLYFFSEIIVMQQFMTHKMFSHNLISTKVRISFFITPNNQYLINSAGIPVFGVSLLEI